MTQPTRQLNAVRDQMFVLGVAEGFFQSAVLLALLELRVFELIDEGSMSVEDLATATGGSADRLHRVLNAGVVLRLLESDDGQTFRVAAACRSVLMPSAGESYLGDWMRNMDIFRLALSKLDEAVLTSKPTVDPAGHLGSSEKETHDFILAMHNYAALRGKELAKYLDTSHAKTVLDLGCGPGTYSFHLGEANPDLKLNLLDLPGVLEVAKEVRSRYDLVNDINYLAVDVTEEEIPGTYDLVLVSNTLHMLGEATSRDLISRLHDTVAPGGSLVIQAQYLQDHRMGGRWPIYLDLLQMCMTDDGRNHTPQETREWMEEAGFERVEYIAMSLVNQNSYLRGYKV